jgi:predicted amidohydrolase YtcJ
VYALSALTEVGSLSGDRIEHASVVDESTLGLMLRVGVCVVTQPNFLVERGDHYLKDVDAQQLKFLYRAKSFLDVGIPLGGGTDAPFGGADPWAAMHAAVHRETALGEVIGEQEKLTPEQAIAMFTSTVDMPGGASRRIAPGQTADLCLLQRPWAEARDRISKDDVAMTVMGGTITYRR